MKSFIASKYHKSDFELKQIKHGFIEDFEFYMKTVKHTSHNSTMKHIKNFKKIVKHALANNLIDNDPFVNFKITNKKVDRGFLTNKELTILMHKKFSIDHLQTVKDCFVFSCFTGLAHSDLKRLSPENLQLDDNNKLWIITKRVRTNSQSNIPVLPVVAEIIEKYSEHPYCQDKNVILPVLSNQKMNAYLKEIGDLCGIEKKFTSHLARHTFATTVTLNNDVPIESVSKMLGHSSLEMTKIYARLLDKKVGKDMEHFHEKFCFTA